MPVRINGQTYYQTAEACRIVGISKNTILRWIREGLFADVELRDRRGWRLFSNDDLDRLKAEVYKIYRNHIPQSQAILLSLR
jgi:excisionase family DNA binding protein